MSQKKITRPEELAALLFNDDSSDSEAAVDKDDSSYLEVAADRDDPSDPEDFTQEGLKAKEVALSISKSIVSLVSSVDGKLLFACTGTVVDHVGSSTWILTSATLVRKPGSDYDAYQGGDIKIEVLLHNKRTIEGCIAMCSLLYNIAVVTIESQLDLPTVNLCDLPGCYFMLIRPVIVVGRDSKSKSLLVRHGEMIRESSKLDCNELLVCTCPVSKILIGGIVMDFERRIIGIAFFDKDTIPFLPIEIVTRCLVHFKDFGERMHLRAHANLCMPDSLSKLGACEVVFVYKNVLWQHPPCYQCYKPNYMCSMCNLFRFGCVQEIILHPLPPPPKKKKEMSILFLLSSLCPSHHYAMPARRNNCRTSCTCHAACLAHHAAPSHFYTPKMGRYPCAAACPRALKNGGGEQAATKTSPRRSLQ